MMNQQNLFDAMLSIEELTDVFSDLKPLPQNDSGEERVCVIQYPSAFVLAYNYMRAVWNCNEMSERALKLSATCAKMNPANYTVWHFRRKCLHALGLLQQKDAIEKDLGLASLLGGTNPKNYQIWYHRRALLENYGVHEFYQSELEYISHVLEEDAKNYHAWSYRQWILLTVNDETLWNKELVYLERLIEEDVRNNSAWNGRWLTVHKRKQSDVLDIDVARQEADFAIQKAAQDPYNESPWRYLVGILKEQQRRDSKEVIPLAAEYEAKAYGVRLVLVETSHDPDACVNLNASRIDLLEMIVSQESLERAIALAKVMASEYDTIREKYWLLRIDQAQDCLTRLSS